MSKWNRLLSLGNSRPSKARAWQAKTRTRRALRLESLERRDLFNADFGSAVNIGIDDGPVTQQGLAADESGTRYMTGLFRGTVDFDPLVNRADGTDILSSANGTDDGFVAKYAADNTLLWARRMGGSAVESNVNVPLEQGEAIAVDSKGNVFVTGNFLGTANFGSYQLTSAGSSDGFLTKLDSNGNFLWAQRWGSAVPDQAYDLSVDSSGNAAVVGTPRQLSQTGGFYFNGMVVRKYAATGNLLWGHQINNLGGTATNVVTDASGSVLVSGTFDGTVDFNPHPKKTADVAGVLGVSSGAGYNEYIWKLSSLGDFQRVTPIIDTANSSFWIADLDIDPAGNVYAGGVYSGAVDFDPGSGVVYRLPTAASKSGFIAKLSAAGQWTWAKSLGADATVDNLVVDASGVYVGGHFSNTFFPTGASALSQSNGHYDIFLVKLDLNGTYQWSTTFGGANYEFLRGLATNGGNIYLAGWFTGTVDFDPDPDSAYELTNPAWTDTFLVTLSK